MSGIGSVRFHSFYISGLIRPENRPQYQTLLGTGIFFVCSIDFLLRVYLGISNISEFFPVANAQRGSRWTETQWTSIIGKHIIAAGFKMAEERILRRHNNIKNLFYLYPHILSLLGVNTWSESSEKEEDPVEVERI